jgi:hypothetical protein
VPWTCHRCGAAVVLDGEAACPACQAPKSNWTLHAEKTRQFRVARGGGPRAERGGPEETFTPEAPDREDGPFTAATTAPALPRACALRLAALGLMPPARHSLWVRVPSKTPGPAPLVLTVNHAAAESVDVEAEAPAVEGGATLRLLLVFGAGPPLPADAFPGVLVVEAGDGTPLGRATSLAVAAGRRRLRELPLEPGLCAECGWLSVRLLDASGSAPLSGQTVALELPDAGRVEFGADAEGVVQLPGVPFADLELEVGEDRVFVPAVPTPDVVHRRHVPHARRGFASLLVRDDDDFPVEGKAGTLVGPDGVERPVVTEEDGLVRPGAGLPPGEHIVRFGAAEARVVLPTTPRGLVIARLS